MNSHIKFAKKLIRILDTRFSILGIKFGIDPMLDVIPGFGSLLGAVISGYLFWIGYKMKVKKRVHLRMLANIALDYFLGIIPGVGIVADLFYRANIKNFAILEKSLDLRSGPRGSGKHPKISEEVLEAEIIEE